MIYKTNYNQDSRIEDVIREVLLAGGSKSWPKSDVDANRFLWLSLDLDILIEAGFVIKTTPAKEVLNIFGHIENQKEMITLMSPEFVKKESVKSKMKQEFEKND